MGTTISALSAASKPLTGAELVPLVQSGVTKQTTAQDLAYLAPLVNVKKSGAVGNGTTDDTTAIQAAITALSAGQILFFPQGTYKITSGLTISQPCVLLGDGNAILAPNFATGDVILFSTVTGNYGGAELHYLTIQPSVTRTANALVNIQSSTYSVLKGCRFIGGYNGVVQSGSATAGLRMEDCRFYACTNSDISLDAQTGTQGSTDVVIEDCLLGGTNSGTQTDNGIYISCIGDCTLRRVNAVWSGFGLNVVAANGDIVQALYVENCLFDSGDSSGIQIATTGTGAVSLVKITDTWSCTNTTTGLLINGSGITQVDVVNSTISNNTGIGINYNAGANVNILGGQVSANTSHGISVAANKNEFSIIDVTIGATGQFAGNGGWGIVINAGTSNNYRIIGNYFDGNTTGTLSDGGTGTSKVISGNLPFSVEAWAAYTPTVTLTGGAGNTVPVYTTNTGRWWRDGQTIHVHVFLSGDGGAEGAGTGQFTLALPVAGKVAYVSNVGRMLNNATLYQLNANITEGAVVILVEYWSSISATAVVTGAEQNNATRSVSLDITYEAS